MGRGRVASLARKGGGRRAGAVKIHCLIRGIVTYKPSASFWSPRALGFRVPGLKMRRGPSFGRPSFSDLRRPGIKLG